MGEKVYTTFQISKICSVDITTIMTWIDDGKLQAYRTPGGHRRVIEQDLVAFLKKYNMPIPSDIRGGARKILVVEDDPVTLRLITRSVTKIDKSFQLETARDGFEAGQKIESFHPDLVILDIFLPGVDGFKVMKMIRSQKKFEKVKICGISGSDVEVTKEKVLRAGADVFLAKPFEPAVLMDTIKSQLAL